MKISTHKSQTLHTSMWHLLWLTREKQNHNSWVQHSRGREPTILITSYNQWTFIRHIFYKYEERYLNGREPMEKQKKKQNNWRNAISISINIQYEEVSFEDCLFYHCSCNWTIFSILCKWTSGNSCERREMILIPRKFIQIWAQCHCHDESKCSSLQTGWIVFECILDLCSMTTTISNI